TPLQCGQEGEEVVGTSDRGLFAVNQAETFAPDPIALGHGEKYLDLADQDADKCRVRHELETPTAEEEAQHGPADEGAVKQWREREAEDHTFEGSKGHQTEPVLKPEEGEAVARQRALLNRIISLQKRLSSQSDLT
ncbi:hypothetical protein, partial [Bradyrhizobium algeriense]